MNFKFILVSVLCGVVLLIGVVADTKIDMSSSSGFCKSVTKSDIEFDKCIKQLGDL